MKISIGSQIQEVITEIEYRKKVYPRLGQKEPRKVSELDYRLKIMEAVLNTLLWLQANEQVIRESRGRGVLGVAGQHAEHQKGQGGAAEPPPGVCVPGS